MSSPTTSPPSSSRSMAADAPSRPPLLGRLTSGQWLAAGSGGLAVVALVAIVVSLAALNAQVERRRLVVEHIGPAESATQLLLTAFVNQETGVRGYVLTRRSEFLEPFDAGERETVAALSELDRYADEIESVQVARDLRATREAITAWRDGYALPAVARVRRGLSADVPTQESKAAFDAARASVATLRRDLDGMRREAVADLERATDVTRACLIIAGLLFVLSTLAVWLTLRRAVGVPLAHLAVASRRVAAGEHDLEITPDGSKDVRELTGDIEAMRGQIVRELAALEEARAQLELQAADLRRSNEELEQFAYVASHDLQEPLRKVASFCQMLERRYGGQFDERGQQYIDFAVDGAKRMQILINDLLAFSRVGRVGIEAFQEVDLGDALDEALENLSTAIEEAGAQVEIEGELPCVRGDAALLAGVFQNLIGNAIKFRGDDPPRVTVTTTPDGDGGWRIEVVDNGIGIEPEYADRIFVIFQRLHAKDDYPGTGIGLAMTRKIIEYHRGRIWLEPGSGPGARFAFTLPAPERTPDA